MSLITISNVVLLLSNPAWYGQSTSVRSTVLHNITALSSIMAYSSRSSQNLTTLAAEYVTSSQHIKGLLYVPDLDPGDQCWDAIQNVVPSKAARRSDLPPSTINLIALAPWVNAQCTQSFLASARTDPIRAFIFYLPGDNTTSRPPSAPSPVWDLGDGGAWRTENRFPVFAVPGSLGNEMMTQLSLYSGNITTVPFGDAISALYDPSEEDYVRIWTQLRVHRERQLHSMWIKIPVVLGVLFGVPLAISLIIHLVQRRRRASLRRRVQDGKVNLEALGIGYCTVPPRHIETFPLFTYSYNPDLSFTPARSPKLAKAALQQGDSTRTDASSSVSGFISAVTASTWATGSEKQHRPRTKAHWPVDYQPVCLICFAEFEDRLTVIRELPCGHIFHRDCIDELLSSISSLCPLCKACMLPRGYSPPITNEMVRREMATRRLRGRIVVQATEDASASQHRERSWVNSTRIRAWLSSIGKRFSSPGRGTADAAPATSPFTGPSAQPIQGSGAGGHRAVSLSADGPPPYEYQEEQSPSTATGVLAGGPRLVATVLNSVRSDVTRTNSPAGIGVSVTG